VDVVVLEDQPAEIAALHVLHHDVGRAFVPAEAVDAHHVLLPHACERTRLRAEIEPGRLVALDHLEAARPLEVDVQGSVHLAHGPAQQLLHAVPIFDDVSDLHEAPLLWHDEHGSPKRESAGCRRARAETRHPSATKTA
jgi:hypothetical protein